MEPVNRTLLIIAVVAVAVISGCQDSGGLRFRDANANLNLPEDWKQRTPIMNTADLRFNMAGNVGLLVTPEKDRYEVLARPILPDKFAAKEEIIRDGAVYSSKITRGASVQGGYLTFAATLGVNQAVDFRIFDICRVDVPWLSFPDTKIRAVASTANPEKRKRLWIQSLILSRILTQSFSELKCDASGAGPAFQIGGKCFSETGVVSHDYAIAAVFVDIDKYVHWNPGGAAKSIPLGAAKGQSPEFTEMTGQEMKPVANEIPASFKKMNGGNMSIGEFPSFISVQPAYGEIKRAIKK